MRVRGSSARPTVTARSTSTPSVPPPREPATRGRDVDGAPRATIGAYLAPVVAREPAALEGLPRPVALRLRAMGPAGLELVKHAQLRELPVDIVLAALTPPTPARAEEVREVWSSPLAHNLGRDQRAFWGSSRELRLAVMAQLSQVMGAPVGAALVATLATSWLTELGAEDQRRALQIVACLASHTVGASFTEAELSQRDILDNTLAALLRPGGPVRLTFFDDPDGVVLGTSSAAGDVYLARDYFPPEARRIDDEVAEYVAVATLAHEINHVVNPGDMVATHEALMDEYRAWFVGFVALWGRWPSRIEGAARVRELFTVPAYDYLWPLLDSAAPDPATTAFLSAFGAVRSLDGARALSCDDYVSLAPRPDPAGNLSNGG